MCYSYSVTHIAPNQCQLLKATSSNPKYILVEIMCFYLINEANVTCYTMASPSEPPFSDVYLSHLSFKLVWESCRLSSSDGIISAQVCAHLSIGHTRSILDVLKECFGYFSAASNRSKLYQYDSPNGQSAASNGSLCPVHNSRILPILSISSQLTANSAHIYWPFGYAHVCLCMDPIPLPLTPLHSSAPTPECCAQ